MAIALSQDKYLAIGFKQQNALTVPLIVTDMVSLAGTAIDIQAKPINEDNAADLGKGVYATNVYPSHIEAPGTWNGRATSEALAIISMFALGVTPTKTTVATTGRKYVSSAPEPSVSGLDMPTTTIAMKVGGVSDKALFGQACEEFGLQLRSGAGRDNAQFTSTWVGTGQFAKPSGITFPAAFVEHSLNAGSLTALSLIGFDYLANKRFSELNFSLKNNMRTTSGYFPGSGSQSGYQLQGRMRRGAPQITLTGKVECASGSSEEDTLLAGTEGTGLITIPGELIGGSEHHYFQLTFPRLRLKATPIGDADGIATYDLEYSILKHASNGVLTVEAQCELDNIMTVAS